MLKISVGGDPEGGHLVDIHDGTTNLVHQPEGAQTDVEAFFAAVKSHGGKLWDDMKAVWSGDTNAVKTELAAARARISTLEATIRDAQQKAQIQLQAAQAKPASATTSGTKSG